MLEPTGTAYVSARQEERHEFDSGLGFHRRLPTVLALGWRIGPNQLPVV
jgi:hypothetical protein